MQRSVTGRVAALELVAKAVIRASRAPLKKSDRRHPGEQPEDQRQHDETVEQRGAGDDDDEMGQALQQPALLAGDQLQEQRGEAERRQAHDPADDHQAKLLQFLDQNADVAVAFAADNQRDAEEEGDDDDGQDFALRQRLERILEQAAQELRDVVWQRHLACLEITGGVGEHGQVQAVAGAENVGGAEADQDRQAHGGEEKGERRRPHAMHLVMRAQVGDADDDG